MSVADDNKARARRIPEEAFNGRNLDVLDDVLTPDYVDHFPAPPGLPSGLEGLKMFVGGLLAAFPDLQYTSDIEIAEGDTVMQYVTARGTHEGEFFGVPGTGRQLEWTEIHISRHENGMIVEHWGLIDQFGMAQQLGIIPS